jgi:hypothetical protein
MGKMGFMAGLITFPTDNRIIDVSLALHDEIEVTIGVEFT